MNHKVFHFKGWTAAGLCPITSIAFLFEWREVICFNYSRRVKSDFKSDECRELERCPQCKATVVMVQSRGKRWDAQSSQSELVEFLITKVTLLDNDPSHAWKLVIFYTLWPTNNKSLTLLFLLCFAFETQKDVSLYMCKYEPKLFWYCLWQLHLLHSCFVLQPLRAGIQKAFYADLGIEETEIFVSDGAKCDITRLQVLNKSFRQLVSRLQMLTLCCNALLCCYGCCFFV